MSQQQTQEELWELASSLISRITGVGGDSLDDKMGDLFMEEVLHERDAIDSEILTCTFDDTSLTIRIGEQNLLIARMIGDDGAEIRLEMGTLRRNCQVYFTEEVREMIQTRKPIIDDEE
ncbi:MAG: hypothetical protein V1848_01095 [Candidatus Magasanikbacteria bacterium]